MKYLLPVLLSMISFCSTGLAQTVEKLSAVQFKQKMGEQSAKQVIDVRTPQEYSTGYISNARNLNVYDKDFAQQVERLGLDKQQPIFVYCKAGGRSASAVKQLKAMGFMQICDLQGGMIAWENAQLPVDGTTSTGEKDSSEFVQADFNKLLLSDKLVVINFYAPWCAPCKEMAPLLDRMAKAHKSKVEIHRINYDEARSLCRQLEVADIPTLLVYRDGKQINRTSGFQSEKQLEALMAL